MSSRVYGMLILIVAGGTNASFTLPMKYARKWAWENIWLAWTVVALILFPTVTALITVPHLAMVYNSETLKTLLEVCAFGAGWGVAQVLFGLAVDLIGIALTFSVVLGTSAAVGTLVPMILLHGDRLLSRAGLAVFAAVALVLTGVLLCAAAGRMRERAIASGADSQGKASLGLILAILCGLGASFVNFGVAFGTPLIVVARSLGASPLNATNAVWLPLMLSGAIPNALYCAFLLKTNRTASRYSDGHSHWALAFVMGACWFGSTLLYGLAAVELGSWGPVIGWPLFMSLIVITASMLGMLTGEWTNAGSRPMRIQWTGVLFLVLAVFVLAGSSRYLQ